jgi:branched-chain amino acid transport system permease protein
MYAGCAPVLFFASLLVDGLLAGAVYALIALAFVVVYKASRMINFALGEWVMFGSRLAAAGLHGAGLGLAGALGFAGAAMVAFALAFNRVVLRRLVGQPLIGVIMVTLGLGALMRGAAPFIFAGLPAAIPLPIPQEPLVVHDIRIPAGRVVALIVAAAAIAGVSAFFRWSRTGVALRALADDQQVALSVGIDVHRHLAIAWGIVGVLAVVAGTLWTMVTGVGFGLVLLGLKVFPIVVIGGLDSIPGSIVGALAIGVLESLTAGYVDPFLGAGFSSIAPYVLLVGVLFVRPYGIFGRPEARRV